MFRRIVRFGEQAMFRKSVMIAGFVVVTGMAATVNAGFSENWDALDPPVPDSDQVPSPWIDAGGPHTVVVRELAGVPHVPHLFLSGGVAITQNDGPSGEASASRPTGVGLNDTNVEAIASFVPEVANIGGFAALVLSPSPLDGGDRWRSVPGSLVLFWTPSFGTELYSVNDAGAIDPYLPFSGVAKTNTTDYVQFRFSTPSGSGAQTATVDWKLATDPNWTNIGSIPLASSFAASHLGLVFNGALWGDDVSISSVPEPASWVLAGLGALVVGLVRRRPFGSAARTVT